MTPSLSIDITIPGVGRIHRRSGVTTERERRAIVAMLQELPKRGHVELVRRVQWGTLKPLELYAYYTANTLDELAGPQLDAPIEPTLTRWLDTADVAESTRQGRRDYLAALAVRKGATFRELAEALKAYRETAIGTPAMFNRTRMALLAFVRDQLGQRNAVWLGLSDVPKLRERKQGGEGYVLADAIRIRDALGAAAGRIWWGMCLTGMNPAEYWGEWTVHQGERIHVAGTKRPGRVRDVPLIDTPTRPELTRGGFRSALERFNTAEGEEVTPKLARKTFDRWMQDAKIPRVRRKRYLGHGKRDVTDDYEWYEVVAYLRDDALTMRAVLPQQGLRMMP